MHQMQVTKVTSNKFEGAVRNLLNDFDASVTIAVNVAVQEVAEEAAKKLRQADAYKKRTGKYNRGWTASSKQYFRGDVTYVVHNKKEYRLAHLLEFGHAVKNGGRKKGVLGSAPAFEHIKPVADEMPNEFDKKYADIMGKQ